MKGYLLVCGAAGPWALSWPPAAQETQQPRYIRIMQPTPDKEPRVALQESLDRLKLFAQGQQSYANAHGIISRIEHLERAGVSTDTFRAQITPDLMSAVVRQSLKNGFDSLTMALNEFHSTQSFVLQTRIANQTPNIPASIDSYAALAARFDIKVSDLYPSNLSQQLKAFEVLWDTREHSYNGGRFQNALLPLMEVAFPNGDISELRMPNMR